jgi:hypothetical protein
VVLDVAKLTAGREDYCLSRLADNREEYLSGHGESPGRWYGHAASLGLEAEASRDLVFPVRLCLSRCFAGRSRWAHRPSVAAARPAARLLHSPSLRAVATRPTYGVGQYLVFRP